MLILVKGKTGSGKSAFAEALTARLGTRLHYIATMRPFGDEGAERVERHRAQRAGLGFVTQELPYAVGQADLPPGAAVLLEDVSNLLANAMFEQGKAPRAVLADIETLCLRAELVVAVTISGLGGGQYSAETLDYMKALHWLNGALERRADGVAELREGRPVWRKGSKDAFA